MSWNIKWCSQRSVPPPENVDSEEAVIVKVREALRQNATDLHITKDFDVGTNDPEYHNITDLLEQGSLIPFLGAGASFSARAQHSPWQFGVSFPPSAAELAHWLANASGLPAWFLRDTQNLSRVASYYVLTRFESSPAEQRVQLLRKIAPIFGRPSEPGKVHLFLAKHAARFPVVVTTNYDMLMEEAFIRTKQPFKKIVHIADSGWQGSLYLQEYRLNEKHALVPNGPRRIKPEQLEGEFGDGNPPLLYKMHGSVDSEVFVITEEDYVDFLSAIGNSKSSIVPAALLRYFEQRSFLFLGYSLEDWNFRVILQNLKVGRRHQGEGKIESEEPAGQKRPRSYGGALLAQKFEISNGSDATKSKIAKRPSANEPKDVKEELRHWAIQLGPTRVDTRIWRTRKVEIHDIDLNLFITQLEEQMRYKG